ncbi:type IV secretion system protein [Variovorax sp. YR216]|uniref:type IV secretion system protein n=1 Tax=Variovorax sp. YR216 TaxID=1882828 RepID=UPI0008984DE4|nr:type IV secretion system protein [Variovorax sp. YR216]SEB26325.1 type IV secretion system protein VirB8 [Variovorax sp. YR216]
MSAGSKTFRGDVASAALQLGGTNKLRQERNRAYLLIALLLICVAGLGGAVAVLAKIHTVIPVVSVLDANGHVIKQEITSRESLTAHESFVQSQINDFVVYCNTFDPAWRQRYADLCRLHATQEVARQYDAETAAENPNNPYYHLGAGGRRSPRITAITAIGKDQVSFQSILEKPGAEAKVEYFTALVHYTYTFKPLALGDRWENPLGFAATAYRKDQELSRQ